MVQLRKSKVRPQRHPFHRGEGFFGRILDSLSSGGGSSRRSYGPPSSPQNASIGAGAVTAREWMQLLAVACCLTIFVTVILPFGSAEGGAGEEFVDINDPKTSNVRHGKELSRISSLSPEYNAIALDVVRTLDCSTVQDPWKYEGGEGEGMDGGGYMGSPDGGWNEGGGAGGEEGQEGGFGGGDDGVGDFGGERVREEGGGDLGGWGPDERRRRRRLQEDRGWGDDENGGERNWNDVEGADWNNEYDGGEGDYGGDYSPMPLVTAKHLLCLAAGAENLPDEATKPNAFQCDPTSDKNRREALLDLWDAARSQMRDDVLKKTLDVAREHKNMPLKGRTVSLWAPWEDEGLKYGLDVVLAGEREYPEGGIDGLQGRLGEHKLYVDIGSALGLTAMAVQFLYPRTAVLAIEPAPPTWFMQGLNFRCNLSEEELSLTKSVLGGVGPKDDHMAKMMWRPESTTSTRTWTAKSEHRDDDIELVVRLRKFRSLLAEGMPDDLPLSTPVSVMNVDCEGCEYDLIPSLTDSDFASIGIVTGEVHWGYIPYEKKPSSDRARRTHERLCRHEAFARNAKECCAFPKSRVEVGDLSASDEDAPTVAELAGELCDNFEEWAEENHLYDIDNDYGWIEISAEARAWDATWGEKEENAY